MTRLSLLKVWHAIRPGKDRPTRNAIALAVAFAVVIGLGSFWDFHQSSDGPRETATVVARHEAGPATCPGVGRRQWDPKWDVTWRSKNPPAGLPAEFVVERVCDENEVGDTVEIIRVIKDGRTKVYQDVAQNQHEVLELGAWTFVFVFLIALTGGWLLFGLSRLWRRVRRTERS